MWDENVCAIQNGLGHGIVAILDGVNSTLNGIPNFTPTLKHGSRFPKLVSLAVQLTHRDGIFTLPFDNIFLKWLGFYCWYIRHTSMSYVMVNNMRGVLAGTGSKYSDIVFSIGQSVVVSSTRKATIATWKE